MTNTTINKIILSATTAMFLTACGGGGGGTTPTAAEAASAKIQAYAVDDNAAQPVLADYQALGLTDVNANNIDEYNDLIKAKDSADEVDELSELNAIIAAANAAATADTIKPVIALNGAAAVSLTVGDAYTDGGATVTDNIDTGLTVTVGGDTVDTTTVGIYTITYNVSDAAGNAADEVTRTVTVSAVPNVTPVATAQAITIDEDTTANAITLAGTDADAGDTLTYDIVTGPSNGTLSGTAPAITYTPNANFAGTDTFTFTVNDGTVDSAEATVTITVNDLPEIVSLLKTGQTVSYAEDGSVDATVFDDGHYQSGVDANFTRDAATDIVTDNVTGLQWTDDTNGSSGIDIGTYTNYCLDNFGTDWRLPTTAELKGIIKYGDYNISTYATFENVGVEKTGFRYYQSSDNSIIDFVNGVIKEGTVPNAFIRCVKGTSDDNNFSKSGDLITDNKRGLVWNDDTTATELKTWTEAISICTGDWRLPNMNELESITDRNGTTNNMVDANFTNIGTAQSSRYWSSTTFADAAYNYNRAWIIPYNEANNQTKSAVTLKTGKAYVRCVKDAD